MFTQLTCVYTFQKLTPTEGPTTCNQMTCLLICLLYLKLQYRHTSNKSIILNANSFNFISVTFILQVTEIKLKELALAVKDYRHSK